MIPVAVNKVFDKYHQEQVVNLEGADKPSLVSRQEVSASQVVRLVLMADQAGKAQVIMPSDCFLKLEALEELSGRSLTALPSEEVKTMSSKYNLGQIPAVPEITGFPTFVDERLMQLDEVFIESEEPDQLIRLSQSLFHASLSKATKGQFVKPVASVFTGPTDPSQDAAAITGAVEKFTSLRIKQRLEDTLELPPLPHSAQDIIKLRSNPDANADQLLDIVERDPSLSAQVVSWASSSFYNAPGKIKSVHDAMVRVLGFDMVMNLAIGLALGKTLKVPRDEPDGEQPYWHQAIWVAMATTALTTKVDAAYRPGFGLAYLSGLLHNFGYLVLAHVFPPHHKLICRHIEANSHLDTSVIEHELLGITREQVVSLLMELWNMPEEVVSALRHQKNSAYDGEHASYSNLLVLAHHHLAKRGILRDTGIQIDDAFYEEMHITPEAAEEAIDIMFDKSGDIEFMAGALNQA